MSAGAAIWVKSFKPSFCGKGELLAYEYSLLVVLSRAFRRQMKRPAFLFRPQMLAEVSTTRSRGIRRTAWTAWSVESAP